MPEHSPAPTSSRAVYGFALSLNMYILLLVYLMWAIVPSSWFESVEITCLPQKYWAIAVPMFSLAVLACAFIMYISMGLYMTPDWSDIRTIKDNFSLKLSNVTNFNPNITQGCNCKNKETCKASLYYDASVDRIKKCNVPLLSELDIVQVSVELYSNIK